MQRDLKTGHLSQAAYTQQAVEILTALKKLGEQVKIEKYFENIPPVVIYCKYFITLTIIKTK